jgi:putative tryptophan/tyrosine transport system substrate-binding protein
MQTATAGWPPRTRALLSRRHFVKAASLATLGGLTGCGRLSGQAQPRAASAVRVGWLTLPAAAAVGTVNRDAFRQGMAELGYVEGVDYILEVRNADGEASRLPDLAAELVSLPLDILIAGSPTIVAARNATSTIPIIMLFAGDPVAAGVVASLPRPGGNVTGLTTLQADLAGKRLELLKECLPAIRRVAFFQDVSEIGGTGAVVERAAPAAQALGVELVRLRPNGPAEYEDAIQAAVTEGAEALSVSAGAFGNRTLIVALAARHKLPTMYWATEFVRIGGLMAYTTNLPAQYRRAALLRGPRPQRRQAGGPPRGASSRIRVSHQPQDSPGAGLDDPAARPAASDGGHPMSAFCRRWFLQGVGMAGLGLVAGCGWGPGQPAPSARLPQIGVLWPGQPPGRNPAFPQGLRDLGYIEGQNIALEYRWDENQPERWPDLAADLVRLKVDVIVAGHTQAAIAAKQATTTIPIVFLAGGDPVAFGLVASLARPGGNATGLTLFTRELNGKRLEWLKEATPDISRIVILYHPDSPVQLPSFETAARTLDVQLQALEVRGPDALDSAFQAATGGGADAVITAQAPFFSAHRARIAELALHSRLPAMSGETGFAAVGGLLNYGPSIDDTWRRAASYVDKILKGTRPDEIPVEQPMRFDFVVNVRTAQPLGLTIPPHVLLQATEIIQ